MTSAANIQQVVKYSIYCDDEKKTVSGWDVTPINYCPNNRTHTVNTATVTGNETVVNANFGGVNKVIYWTIWCNTESARVGKWSETIINTCPNDPAHSVNLASIESDQSVAADEVIIKEDIINVGRSISNDCICMKIPSNTTMTKSYTFKIPTSFYSYRYLLDYAIHSGDELTISVNPNTTLGLITQNITAGNTIISPPAPIFTFGQVGYTVTVTDGTNTNELGIIKNINSDAKTIEIETAAVNNFSSTNTLLRMTYYVTKDMMLSGTGVVESGNDVIGGSAIPVGTTVSVTYKNKNTNISDPDKYFTLILTNRF